VWLTEWQNLQRTLDELTQLAATLADEDGSTKALLGDEYIAADPSHDHDASRDLDPAAAGPEEDPENSGPAQVVTVTPAEVAARLRRLAEQAGVRPGVEADEEEIEELERQLAAARLPPSMRPVDDSDVCNDDEDT
jgi:hypothetical protein